MDKRGLVGYSPWGHKELERTEQLTLWKKTRGAGVGMRRGLRSPEMQRSPMDGW